jgi:hypothetical protein
MQYPSRPSSILAAYAAAQQNQPLLPPQKWLFVTPRFTAFLENLKLTPQQADDGDAIHRGIRACLNQHYWRLASDTANSMLIGSWGKFTRVRPPRDIDVMFFLPWEVYRRFEGRIGNRQSQLLQEVRDVISTTYSSTAEIAGDRQVVVVPLTKMTVEVVPAFLFDDGRVWVCDTASNGAYKIVAPTAEIANFDWHDQQTNGNLRALVRMAKQWQRQSNANDLKSFQIELLAIDFLKQWPYRANSVFWYDWMVRDFFAYLHGRANSFVSFPTTVELSWVGDGWQARAQRAYRHAAQACEYETSNQNTAAGWEWQQIFGSAVPLTA